MRITPVTYTDINLINNGEFLVGANSIAITGFDENLTRLNTDLDYVQKNKNHGRFCASNWLIGQMNIPTTFTWRFEWKLVHANTSIIGGNTSTNPTSNCLYFYQPTKVVIPDGTSFKLDLATYPLSAEDVKPYLNKELTLSFEIAFGAFVTPPTGADVQFSVALVYPHGEKSSVYTFTLKGQEIRATPKRIRIPIVLPEDWFSNICNGKYAPITHPGSGGKIIFLCGSNEYTETNINGVFNTESETPKFRHKDDYLITEFRRITLGKVHLGPTQANFVFKARLREAVRLACLQRQQAWDSGYGIIAKNDYIPFYRSNVTIASGSGYVGYSYATYGSVDDSRLTFNNTAFVVNRVEAQLTSNTVVFECWTQDTTQDLSGFPNTSATLRITLSDGVISHTHTLQESRITKGGNPQQARIVNSFVNAAMTAFLNANLGNTIQVKIERVETQYVDVLLTHHTPISTPRQFIETFINPTDSRGSPLPYYMYIKNGTINADFPEPGKIIEQTPTNTTIRIPLLRHGESYSNTPSAAKDIGTRLRIVRNAVTNATSNFLDDLTPEPLDNWFGCLMKHPPTQVRVRKQLSGTFFDSNTGGGTRPSVNLTTSTIITDPTQDVENRKPVPVVGSVYWGDTTIGSSLLLVDVERGEIIINRFMRRDPADIDLSLYQVRLEFSSYPGGLTVIVPLKYNNTTMFIGTAQVTTEVTTWFYNNPDTLVIPFTFNLEPKP